MQSSLTRLKRDQSGREETANAISHALRFIGAVIGTPILITQLYNQTFIPKKKPNETKIPLGEL